MAKKRDRRRKDAVSDRIREERAKLSASFVSAIGVGVIVIGVARPVFDPGLNRALLGPAPREAPSPQDPAGAPDAIVAAGASYDVLVIAISMLVGFICHMVARALLRRMAPPLERERAAKEASTR